MLRTDLEQLPDRMRDEKFATELYRALAGNRWVKNGEEAVALSWKLADELVNDLRRRVDRPPLPLYKSGGEGQVDDTVRAVLEPLGWRVEPLDTDEHDPAHLSSAPDPPPASRPDPQTPPVPRPDP